ncbi:MAG: glycosyltransferase, partial [Bdellovibrionales bacterium]|nr:glycosyltransferase [Bdellovibrionales bacterium]
KGISLAKGDYLIFMDTDFNHDPKDITKMLKNLPGNDVVIGSRFVKGGGMEGAKLRWYCSYAMNQFIKISLRLPTKENLSGYILISKSALFRCPLEKIFKGYGDYNISLFKCLADQGAHIKEVPVYYKERTYGESKTRFVKHLIEYLRTVWRVRKGV